MIHSNREKQIRKDVTKFYDDIAPRFSQTRKNWWSGLGFFRRYVEDGDKVLDFGCGNGRFLEFIYRENLKIKYIGTDVSKELLTIAKSRYKEERFELIEEEGKMDFKAGQFDKIVSVAVFHHFTPRMAHSSLKEFRRVLKKDGVVIITAWHLWNHKRVVYLIKSFLKNLLRLNFYKVAKLPFSFSEKKKGQKTFWRTCYWWSKRELERVARKNKFEVLESGFSRDNRNNKRNIYLVLKK